MPIRKPRISKVSINFIVFGVFLSCFPGKFSLFFSGNRQEFDVLNTTPLCVRLICLFSYIGCILSATVTLGSIVIYDTHEFIKGVKPIVYFTCQGENKTVFPDVKEKNVSYEFKGEESWQVRLCLCSKFPFLFQFAFVLKFKTLIFYKTNSVWSNLENITSHMVL